MIMLLGITPLRISFAGGGTDMPEYYERYIGKVVTSTITHFVYVFTTQREDNSFQAFSSNLQSHHEPTSYDKLKPKYGSEIAVSVVKHLKYKEGRNFLISSDSPAGSGLGASGSLAVNLVNTINSLRSIKWDKEKVAETAFEVGRNVLGWPIGKQDEYSTIFGGLNYIEFHKNRVKVTPITANNNSISELQQNLILFFVGTTRNSSSILTSQIENTKKNKPETISSLHKAKELAELTFEAISNNDITKIGEILHQGWLAKKKFTANVSNKFIDDLYRCALNLGATGGKLTGAGGGGHLLLYCEKQKQPDLITHLEKIGLRHVKFKFYKNGSKLLNLYDFAKR